MRLEKLKTAIANVIEPKKKASVISIIYNILISLIVLISCGFIFVDVFVPGKTIWHQIAFVMEIVAVSTFGLEYLLKLFVSEVLYPGYGWFKSKVQYFTSFDSFVDIICLLSILINQIPKEFAVLRLLKLIKLTRLTKLKNSIEEMTQGDEKKEEKLGLKHRIYQIIYQDKEGDKLSKAYDIISIIIILLSVTTLVLDTFTFPDPVEQGLFIAEIVFTCFFGIDYILRVWTSEYAYPDVDKDHAKTKYIFSLIAIIDLLAMLPILFTFSPDAEAALPKAVAILKIFKILKIARLLKMSRYLNGIKIFVDAVKAKKKQIFFSIVILVFLVIISSILLYSFESMAGNTQFTDGFSGIVYAITVLTGFGESSMEVISIGGKAMVVIMMIAGACVVGVPLGIISGEFTTMVEEAAHQHDENEDLFISFTKKLSVEQKMKIIADYQKELEEKDNDNNEN